MALPKLNNPTYELELPSTGEKITYRPFLVKEQKLLMIAQESEDHKQMFNAIGQMINSCTFNKIDAKNAPVFDIEYIFLKLRSKSAGETAQVRVVCPDDEETEVVVKINLDEINVQMTKDHTNIIQLTDDIKMKLKYPQMSDMSILDKTKNQSEGVFEILNLCIEEIHDKESIFNISDISKKELEEFIESMDTSQLEKVMDFFNTMPKLRHNIEVTNPKTKVKGEIVLEGLQNFLG